MLVINNPRAGQSLGDLWREAEALGRIEVDHEIGSPLYRVRIRFDRERSGTTVWATGRSQIIEQAMAHAISEAIDLGAPGKTRGR